MNKLRIGSWVLSFVMLAWLPAAWSQAFPSRPIRIILPFSAGGGVDIHVRQLAQQLQKSLGQQVIIDNRPGGNYTIGMSAVAKAPADGYTLGLITSSHSVVESAFPAKPYALLKDFVPVAGMNITEFVLVTAPSSPAHSVKELIAQAAGSTSKLNYGSTGNAGLPHLAGELLQMKTGISLVHIPYKSSATARSDLINGQTQLMFDVINNVAPLAREGRVRALATTGRKRSAVLPDVPTMHEAGLADFYIEALVALVAPAGTPEAVVDTLNKAVAQALAQPELIGAWRSQGAEALTLTPAQLKQRLHEDVEQWSTVVRSSNIRIE